MNMHREAEKNIKLLVSMTKGLAALVPELEKLGSIEKMQQEAQGRAAEANGAVEAAAKRLAGIEAEVAARLAAADVQAAEKIEVAARLKEEAEAIT